MSAKPRKQRKALYNAKMHERQKMMTCCVSEQFAKEIKRKKLAVRKGDEVKVMRGEFRGFAGKVSKVDLKKVQVFIDGLKRKKVSGQEAPVPLHPSKIMITGGDASDKMRMKARKK